MPHTSGIGRTPPRRACNAVKSSSCARWTLLTDDDTAVPETPLPLGQHGPRVLKFEDDKLALTDELLEAVFRAPAIAGGAPANLLNWEIRAGVGARDMLNQRRVSGYVRGADLAASFVGFATAAELDGQYWLRSGIAGFGDGAKSRYYLPERYTDCFGNTTTLEYDERDLYIRRSTDALGNQTTVTRFDYRILAPVELEDVNGNHTEASVDVLGRVVAVAVKGKWRDGAWEGDDLSGFDDVACQSGSGRRASLLHECPFEETQAREWLRPGRHPFHLPLRRRTRGAGDIVWAQRPAMACAVVRESHASQPGPNTSQLASRPRML